jgi:phosphoglycerol transferase
VAPHDISEAAAHKNQVTYSSQANTHSAISGGTSSHQIPLERATLLLCSGLVAVFIYLIYRNLGLYATVMADEWAYSSFARLVPSSKSQIPSYLYFWIFRQTNHAGASYLDCARLFNSIFYVAAGPFIYLLARRIMKPSVAAFVALISILGPSNTYTAYFMPESMYFFGFWVLSWFLFAYQDARPIVYGSVIGFLLCCLSMVKVHSIFLVPGVVALIAASALRSREPNRFTRAGVALICLAAAGIAIRLLLGYAFAGVAGLHVLGQKYGAVADSSLNTASFLRLSSAVLFVVGGHLLGLALLFGVPLAALFCGDNMSTGGSQGANRRVLLKVYTAAVLFSLLVVTAYFTASVAGQKYEALGRLHQRYYNFALPLLFMVAGAEWSAPKREAKRWTTMLIALVIGATAVASTWMLRTYFLPNSVDSPEIRAVMYSRWILYFVGCLGIIATVIWGFKRRAGTQIFVFLFIPISVLASAYFANHELRMHRYPNLYQEAGQFARQVLTTRERSNLAVVGSDEILAYMAIFQVDAVGSKMVLLPEGRPVNLPQISLDCPWILVVGDHPLPPEVRIQFPMNGYALFSRAPFEAIRFSRLWSLHDITAISGMSVPEDDGRWSDGKEVQITMATPLPKHFSLNLTASAFGPNVELPFVIRIGNAEQSFHMPALPTTISMDFTTSGNERYITIEVPQPTSPKELGMSGDTRRLGILLKEMSIVPRSETTAPLTSTEVREGRRVVVRAH